jgi:hypothetical protein
VVYVYFYFSSDPWRDDPVWSSSEDETVGQKTSADYGGEVYFILLLMSLCPFILTYRYRSFVEKCFPLFFFHNAFIFNLLLLCELFLKKCSPLPSGLALICVPFFFSSIVFDVYEVFISYSSIFSGFTLLLFLPMLLAFYCRLLFRTEKIFILP